MKRIFALAVLFAISVLGFSQGNEQFILLFNGKDLTGWSMPGETPGFEVIDGAMVAEPSNGSDIFTTEEFANYIFRFEYLLSEVGNSGVLIRCTPENPWGTGVEVQLLAPWTPYRDDLHCTGSLYGHVAVTNRPDETTGVWHEMEIKCDRNFITISVDRKVVTTADIDAVESMKDKQLSGSIGFQSNHSKKGEFAQFRNIAVKNLDADPDYVAEGFYAKDIRYRKQAWKAAMSIGAPIAGHLVKIMEDENPVVVTGAKQVLFDITAQVTDPNESKGNKSILIDAIRAELKNQHSVSVNAYLQWLLEMANN